MKKLTTSAGVLTSIGCFLLLFQGACASDDGGAAAGDESEIVQNKECDLQKARCEIPVPNCPRGQTPSVVGDCFGACVPIAQCKPKSFECNEGPALCEIVPPTCAAGQTLTTKGSCFGPCVPSNVCKSSAPTPPPSGGGTGTKNCDISKVACEILPQECPEGQTLTASADGFCFGGCVPFSQCKPKSFNCNQGGPALCEIVPPTCKSGEKLTTRDGCFGPCVPSGICK